ncbi:GapA-binding peptide SR1P [Paenibacillus piri]|uniref:GapA-binding peptide SR1P n=1 Tax=Paenibacillus piri TaxID=2547395 RepID=A0A4R5KAB1_9BACL|nr:GapA-binding peptide SR1P [Paenibacillus piri]
MGIIVCKHCQSTIATFDSERLITYYSDCRQPECLELRKEIKEKQEC